jgi:arylsulfatase A-like enzyme
MLAEHDCWAKCWMPFYEEIAHAPLLVWDPRCGLAGQRRSSLVQTIDLAPTIMEFFGADRTPDMQGVGLRQTLIDDTPVRQAGLFGIHGGHVNVTDGRYVYMRAPARADNGPLFNYTLMPTHMRGMFRLEELRPAEMARPFAFTKGCPLVRTPASAGQQAHKFGTLLFDVQNDPRQQRPLHDGRVESMMIEHLVREMKANDSPAEQFERLGLKS